MSDSFDVIEVVRDDQPRPKRPRKPPSDGLNVTLEAILWIIFAVSLYGLLVGLILSIAVPPSARTAGPSSNHVLILTVATGLLLVSRKSTRPRD